MSWQNSLSLHSCLTAKKTTSVFKAQTPCGVVQGDIYTMDLPSEVSGGGISPFPPLPSHEGLGSAGASGYCHWHIITLQPH